MCSYYIKAMNGGKPELFNDKIENYLSMTTRLLLHSGQTKAIKCIHVTLTYIHVLNFNFLVWKTYISSDT